MSIIKILLLYWLMLATVSAGWFSPDNYWECNLENLKEVQSDTIAQEAINFCKDKFPFHERLFVEKKQPWFGVKTANQCVLKHGKQIKSELAARHIQAACYKLYPDK